MINAEKEHRLHINATSIPHLLRILSPAARAWYCLVIFLKLFKPVWAGEASLSAKIPQSENSALTPHHL